MSLKEKLESVEYCLACGPYQLEVNNSGKEIWVNYKYRGKKHMKTESFLILIK